VALGLYRLDGADLVLSGINLGSNLGHEIWYSGTVAAARQAALLGVPAAAFSLVGGEIDAPQFEDAVPYVERVVRLLLKEPALPLVNVNLPAKPQGVRWTSQSVRAHTGRVVEGQDTFGRRHYWLAESPLTDPDEGTDRWAVERGLVSLTPLRLDLTDPRRPAASEMTLQTVRESASGQW
jgi:5'-nucleotidase